VAEEQTGYLYQMDKGDHPIPRRVVNSGSCTWGEVFAAAESPKSRYRGTRPVAGAQGLAQDMLRRRVLAFSFAPGCGPA